MREKTKFCIKLILFLCLIFGAAICVVCLNVIQDKSVDNKDYYPIQIGQAEYVEAITIEVGSNSGTISEKEDIEAFVEYIENLKMKKGTVEMEYEDPSICIKVEYKEEYQGEKIDYCRGIGQMIKLSESSYDAYNISDEDYKIFLEYITKLGNDEHAKVIMVAGVETVCTYMERDIELEYFYTLDYSSTYDEVVENIGEPNGTIGEDEYPYYVVNEGYVLLLFTYQAASKSDELSYIELSSEDAYIEEIYFGREYDMFDDIFYEHQEGFQSVINTIEKDDAFQGNDYLISLYSSRSSGNVEFETNHFEYYDGEFSSEYNHEVAAKLNENEELKKALDYFVSNELVTDIYVDYQDSDNIHFTVNKDFTQFIENTKKYGMYHEFIYFKDCSIGYYEHIEGDWYMWIKPQPE